MEDGRKKKEEFYNRLYKFTLLLIKFIDALPKDSQTGTLANQLLRSGTSVIANYTEGQSASSKKDFTNFLNHSLKSANESRLWLKLLQDSGKTGAKLENDVVFLLSELTAFAKILASSILTLRRGS